MYIINDHISEELIKLSKIDIPSNKRLDKEAFDVLNSLTNPFICYDAQNGHGGYSLVSDPVHHAIVDWLKHFPRAKSVHLNAKQKSMVHECRAYLKKVKHNSKTIIE